MRRAFHVLAVAVTQIAAVLAFASPADANHYVQCNTSYDRTSPVPANYETADVETYCFENVARIDLTLTYVYCTSNSTWSCNSTGSSFGAPSVTNFWTTSTSGGVYNLRGWYKGVVRVSYTMYPGHALSAGRDTDLLNGAQGSCGSSSPDYYSCAFETAVFYRA